MGGEKLSWCVRYKLTVYILDRRRVSSLHSWYYFHRLHICYTFNRLTNAKWVPWACVRFNVRAKGEMKCCLKLRTSSIIICCFRFSLHLTNQFNKSYSFSFWILFIFLIFQEVLATCVWTGNVYEGDGEEVNWKIFRFDVCRLNDSLSVPSLIEMSQKEMMEGDEVSICSQPWGSVNRSTMF